ncbi:MAG: hypothetical protein RIR62_1434 [Pseudomonadota bacterium]
MIAAPAAHLVDLTRLVSRQDKGALTGIDRVERAWLDHLLSRPDPLFGLVRTRLGYLLLDRRGAALVSDLAPGRAGTGPDDLTGRLTRRGDPARGRAEATLRRVARARIAQPFLARALRRHLPDGGLYLNLGHTNLTARTLRGVARAGLRAVVMVHDTIPLDHPEFSRAGTAAAFAAKLRAVADHAACVIHLTQATRRTTEAQLARLGRVPPAIVAPLGITPPHPDPAALPAGLATAGPYFVALGTIEPRKNHALLLDVWAGLAQGGGAIPHLFILGNRGWADPALLARLDARPAGITVLHGLPDGAVAALLAGARALLFPTRAEGYGLPPLEAAALGTPVVCSNLPVLREVLSEYPVYLDPSDSYAWLETISGLAGGSGGTGSGGHVSFPSWDEHFNAVLSQSRYLP